MTELTDEERAEQVAATLSGAIYVRLGPLKVLTGQRLKLSLDGISARAPIEITEDGIVIGAWLAFDKPIELVYDRAH